VMAIHDLPWRDEVVKRDNGECQAPRIDPKSGPCYDKHANRLPYPNPIDQLEADYIRLAAVGGRHQMARDHVLLCPGHHRGVGPSHGYVWATAHRRELRDYLERIYKDDRSPNEAAAERAFANQNIRPDPVTALAKTPPPDGE